MKPLTKTPAPIQAKALPLLAKRGIAPGLRGSSRSQNAGIASILLRLDRLAAVADLEACLGAEAYGVALGLLSNPWLLGGSEIETLPTLMRLAMQAPSFVPPAGFDTEAFLRRIAALDYADRLALVCRAEHALAAAAP